jgi:hypothetical protein
VSVIDLITRAAGGFKWPNDACLYCGSITDHTEQDHFPIPACFGGKETVRACVACHDLKDRLSFKIVWRRLECEMGDNNSALHKLFLNASERAFVCGLVSLLEWELRCLVDDLRDYPPILRVVIARRIRAQAGGSL